MSRHDHSSLAAARPDFAAIAAWIPQGASVLDLGCGDGSLLRYLKETRGVRGYGVEISDVNIVACIPNGVNVIQSDLESGLSGFRERLLRLRDPVADPAGHAPHRTADAGNAARRARGHRQLPQLRLLEKPPHVLRGNMPVSKELPYQWYDTPNVHLCTLHDFENFCRDHKIRILERRVMTGE